MKRAVESALALAVVIAVPTGLLWLIGLAYGALQDAAWWQTWPESAQAALWLAVAVGGLGLLLFLIRQLMRLAQEWPPRWRSPRR